MVYVNLDINDFKFKLTMYENRSIKLSLFSPKANKRMDSFIKKQNIMPMPSLKNSGQKPNRKIHSFNIGQTNLKATRYLLKIENYQKEMSDKKNKSNLIKRSHVNNSQRYLLQSSSVILKHTDSRELDRKLKDDEIKVKQCLSFKLSHGKKPKTIANTFINYYQRKAAQNSLHKNKENIPRKHKTNMKSLFVTKENRFRNNNCSNSINYSNIGDNLFPQEIISNKKEPTHKLKNYFRNRFVPIFNMLESCKKVPYSRKDFKKRLTFID